MEKKTSYNKEKNEQFAKDKNLEIGKKYIQILSPIDKFGKCNFILWFYHSYFWESTKEWKGQSYYASIYGHDATILS